jgi:hypothetical protein
MIKLLTLTLTITILALGTSLAGNCGGCSGEKPVPSATPKP